MLPDNVGYIFDAALRTNPEQTAVLMGEQVLSFAQLHERCNRVANALHDLGVGATARVAMLVGNSLQFIETLLGTMRIGAVPVPLNPRIADESLLYALTNAEAVTLIADRSLAERAVAAAGAVKTVRHVIVDAPSGGGQLEYEPLLQAASISLERRRTEPHEICLQPYTSGSTGRPKGVLLTHGGQTWASDAVRKAWLIDHRERALVTVPMVHKSAMIGVIKPVLLAGGSFVILHGFDPKQVIRAIDRYGVTFMAGVPAMYQAILAESDLLRRHDVSSLKLAMVGSAEACPDLLDDFHRCFRATMLEVYGLTEGGPCPLLNSRQNEARPGSCGQAFAGSEVKLIADDGVTEVGREQVGELVVRNPGVAAGYWKLPELTAAKFRDGWFFTGDLMRKDKAGYFYFVGRKDDMINIGGQKVYPQEVEAILLRHPNIASAVVVSVPHPLKNHVPVAFVTERHRSASSEEEIKQFFLRHGAAMAHPRRVYFVEVLPLGRTGKVDRLALGRLAVQYEEKDGR